MCIAVATQVSSVKPSRGTRMVGDLMCLDVEHGAKRVGSTLIWSLLVMIV